MNGFFIVDKPSGITSQKAVLKVSQKFNNAKCGHSGTLDPETTGVLVVALNQATKMLKFLNEHDKEYITTIAFGYNSNTLDIYGNITEDIDMKFSLADLKEKLAILANRKTQIPPMVSAIKVNGKKLYELERKGISYNPEERNVKLYDYEILSDLRCVDNHLEIDLRLSVSKGFYVRSFARDLGVLLNGCAVMKSLRRIKSGQFSIDKATKLEDLEIGNLYSITDIFDFDILNVNDYIAHLALNGVVLDERQIKIDKPFYVKNNDKIIAIYEPVGKYQYKPVIIFKG